MNSMNQVRIEKITLNIGAGKEQVVLEKGVKLIKKITGIEPMRTVTTKRIPAWGLRPGLPIGCKLTLRKQKAKEILQKLIAAKENKLKEKQFDDKGNLAFGIHEYIDIPEIEYDPEIGNMGLEVCVTLDKPGYRVKKRKIKKTKVSKKHQVSKEEAIKFIKEKFDVEVIS
ncbi:50S ribosomal protein L5 [Candidatus Woesearchaeota archaeon CG10_big_fil_rev_8_21_14_0_10_30_7]|nr:MAG: 50S ribosomal protein L5 [Candidatus Woesearchaeota archaeon CG10_big_fil_rev_8_21_14_0_10_30_7]